MNKLERTSENKYEGKSYLDDYELFIKNLQTQGGLITAVEVGAMMALMAHHFNRHNLILVRSLKLFNTVSKDVYSSEENGKSISAAKAEIIAAATPEAAGYHEAKIHVQNIETNINALEALQKGILNEYSYSAT